MATVLATLLAVVFALLVVLIAGLLRHEAPVRHRRRSSRVDLTAPPPGSAAAADDIVGTTPRGNPVRIQMVGASRRVLLLFLTTTCTTCARLWEAVASPARRGLPEGTHLVIVTKGEEAESSVRLGRLAPAGVPVVMSTAAWETYRVAGAPYCILVDGDSGSVVAAGPRATWDDVVSACWPRARVS